MRNKYMKVKEILAKHPRKLLAILAIIALLVPATIPQIAPFSNTQQGILRTVSAAGTIDYTLLGTNDNARFQLALDELPATGGTLQVVSTGIVNWADGVTVTRAIDSVVIQGAGIGTLFDGDGVTPIFTAGGDYWSFRDFATDAGGLDTGITFGWSMTNILIDADHYAYRGFVFEGAVGNFAYLSSTELTAPTGRGATLVVAASDASATSKAQADYVCDEIADDVEINAAIAAVGGESDGVVILSEGTFVLATTINGQQYVDMQGRGHGTILDVSGLAGGAASIAMAADSKLSDLKIVGDIIPLPTDLTHRIETGNRCIIENIWMQNVGNGINTGTDDGVKIRNVRFDGVHNVATWGYCVHSQGKNLLVDGFDIRDVDRGIEIEGNGGIAAHDIIVKNGYIYDADDMPLDCHGHNTVGDKCYNILFEGVTVENSAKDFGVYATGVNGSPEHITIRNCRGINNASTSVYVGNFVKDIVIEEHYTDEDIFVYATCEQVKLINNRSTGVNYIYANNTILVGPIIEGGNGALRLNGNNQSVFGGYISNDTTWMFYDYGTNNLLDGITFYGAGHGLNLANSTSLVVRNCDLSGVGGTKIYDLGVVDLQYYEVNTITFIDVRAVTSDYVRNNQDLSIAVPFNFTIDAAPDQPRTLTWDFTHANITAFSLNFEGYRLGQTTICVEVVTEADGWSGETDYAYYSIYRVRLTARTGTGVGDLGDIGIGTKLALPSPIRLTSDVFKVTKNQADYSGAGNITVNTTFNTVDLSTGGAIGGGDDFIIWIRKSTNNL